MRVLLGIDASSSSDAAVRECARMPLPPGSEVKLVAVVDLTFARSASFAPLPPDLCQEIYDDGRTEALEALARAARLLADHVAAGVTVTTEVLVGSPAACMLNEARQWEPDLVVVGSHEKSAFDRLLLGSVSNALLRHARCPVEIVRAAGTAGAATSGRSKEN